MAAEDVLAELKKAVRGLRYPSEKDSRIEVFPWREDENPNKGSMLRRVKAEKDTPCEVGKLEDFFAGLTEDQDWHGPREKAAVRRFVKLRERVTELLSGVKVYRLGRGRKSLVLVGRTESGEWVGLETEVLET